MILAGLFIGAFMIGDPIGCLIDRTREIGRTKAYFVTE